MVDSGIWYISKSNLEFWNPFMDTLASLQSAGKILISISINCTLIVIFVSNKIP
jgi:hypothetical protein